MKQKKCKNCNELFTPHNSLQKACSVKCAIELTKNQNRKEFKQETRKLKEKIKTRSDWMREAQHQFNRYVRLRDSDMPCISCGRHHEGQYHAGHYRTVKAHPEIRFNELNCHKQCQPCNAHLSGNLIEYRKSLRIKIGDDLLEYLEGPHEAKKYTIEELKEIKQLYNYFANQLEKELTY